LFLVSY